MESVDNFLWKVDCINGYVNRFPVPCSAQSDFFVQDVSMRLAEFVEFAKKTMRKAPGLQDAALRALL